MDDDKLKDIYEYFKESETDSVDIALDELGEDYSEEDIRLVRIKFLSEVANWPGLFPPFFLSLPIGEARDWIVAVFLEENGFCMSVHWK